ncbi:MAG TPA: hypothetical protein VFH51_04430, partial [Myxococcota bacterium]|nr:hypothetical protein [Myxococcota bacterium]
MPQALAAVPLHQQTYTHTPHTKLLEFFVAILAGLPHLLDISRAAHPLDQDRAVADAWGQPAWADASGVCRALQALTTAEAEAVTEVFVRLSQPFVDQEVLLALRQAGRVVYDGDLTGRPVANSSTSYPGAAYGHMSDVLQLGYQAALVSIHSPTYGRLWLRVQPHPGNTLSCSQALAMLCAAETATGVRPRRRVELVQARLQGLQQECDLRSAQLSRAQGAWTEVEATRRETQREVWYWQQQVAELQARASAAGRPDRPQSKLNRARARLAVQEARVPKLTHRLGQIEQWVAEAEHRLARVQGEHARVAARLAAFEQDNSSNRAPIQAVFRLDGGFGTGENVSLLIEWGYEVYTKPYSPAVTERLRGQITEQTVWTRVG